MQAIPSCFPFVMDPNLNAKTKTRTMGYDTIEINLVWYVILILIENWYLTLCEWKDGGGYLNLG